jgi:hypothetical protein
VPALRKRLFERLAAPVTELTQFGRACGNFEQGAARACNGAPQHLDEHPWCSQSYASPVLFLPRLIGNLFQDDSVALAHDLVDLFAMQALAVRSQFAFLGSLPATGPLVGLAAVPAQLLLAAS